MNRYDLLGVMIAQHKPETIVEIGVGEGRTAELMIREALKHRPTVYYMGFDLFEDATPEDDSREFNVKKHIPQEEIALRLGEIKHTHPGFDFILKKGNTRNETEGITADFAFIDGGHSLETIENDYELVKDSKVIVFDDFYAPEGDSPDISRFGANQIVERLGAVTLGEGDPVKGGGKVHLAVFPPEAVPKTKLKVKSRNCQPDDVIQDNVEYALSLGLPFVQHCRGHDRAAIMCSGGPSLEEYLGKISVEQQAGGRVVCVKHSHDLLIENNIIPWGCFLLDPRDHVRDFIETPHPDVIYFAGSMVHPSTLQNLIEKNARVFLYHAQVGAGEERIVRLANRFMLREHARIREKLMTSLEDGPALQRLLSEIEIPSVHRSDKLIPGGTTSAMRGINVLFMLGFRKFRLYGYDSCFREKPDMTETKNGQARYLEVTVCGETFWTDGELVCQYQDLQNLMKFLPDLDIEVYGDGMFPHGFRHMKRLPTLEGILGERVHPPGTQ